MYQTKTAHFALLSVLLPIMLAGCQPQHVTPGEASSRQAAESPAVEVYEGFEGSKLGKAWGMEFYTKTAGMMSRDVARSGKQAMRFSWQRNQNDSTNASKHSEIKAHYEKEPESWYGYSLYLPSSSMKDDDRTAIVTQWHGVADPGLFDTSPPLSVELVPGNHLVIFWKAQNRPMPKPQMNVTGQGQQDLGECPFDRWVDFVVHVRFDQSGKGENTILQVWQDGELKVNKTTIPLGYLQQRVPYWKVGLYVWPGSSRYDEKVLYVDECRMTGSNGSYEAVRPRN